MALGCLLNLFSPYHSAGHFSVYDISVHMCGSGLDSVSPSVFPCTSMAFCPVDCSFIQRLNIWLCKPYKFTLEIVLTVLSNWHFCGKFEIE